MIELLYVRYGEQVLWFFKSTGTLACSKLHKESFLYLIMTQCSFVPLTYLSTKLVATHLGPIKDILS